jgi:uncharacterized oxidoreductase
MLSFYVDPAVVDPEHLFPDEVNRFFGYIKSASPAEAGGEVLMPGEPEARMRAERMANGIPLPDDTWAALVATAASLGVPAPNAVGAKL